MIPYLQIFLWASLLLAHDLGDSFPVTAPFNTVLFHGVLSAQDMRLEVSVQLEGGKWSRWQPAYLRRFPNGRFWGKTKLDRHTRGAVRIRAMGKEGRLSQAMEIIGLSVFSDAPSREPAVPLPPQRTFIASPAPQPHIWERESWNAAPPKGSYEKHLPYFLTLHHTAGLRTVSWEDSKQEVLFLQDFHQNGRGWIDIGYHFLIDGEGSIFQGRPLEAVGTHVRGGNEGNVGIAAMGYYHEPYRHVLSATQMDSLVALSRWLTSHGVDAETLKGHRDYNPTACPGDGIYPLLAELKERILDLPETVSLRPVFDPLTLRLQFIRGAFPVPSVP